VSPRNFQTALVNGEADNGHEKTQ